jgi:multiple sugar transport system substrate-binding protein
VFEHRNDKGQLVQSGYLPTVPGWYLNQTYFWFGGHIWDPVHEKFTLTDPAVVRAYEWVQSYSKRLGAEAINDFHSGMGTFDSPQNEFMSGMVAMEQQGPWMANYIYNKKPSLDGLAPGEIDDTTLPLEVRRKRMQWAVAPFPSAVPGVENITYCAFDTFVIPRGARHPNEAFKFIAFVNRQDEMEKLCNLHSKNSPLKNSSRQFLEHSKNAYIDVFDSLADSPNARGLPQVPILAEVNDELANAIDRIALMKAEPKVALQEAQDRLQQHYDLFAARQRARFGP